MTPTRFARLSQFLRHGHWEATNNVVRADVVGRIIHLEPQFRPEIARPRFGLAEQDSTFAQSELDADEELAEVRELRRR